MCRRAACSLAPEDTKGAATFQKLGVSSPSFFPVNTNVQLYSGQIIKCVMGERNGERVQQTAAHYTESESAVSSPSGVWGDAAQTIWGRFIYNFMRFHASFSAFNSCVKMEDSFIPLLASRFDVFL